MGYVSEVIDRLDEEIIDLKCECAITKTRYKVSDNGTKMYCVQCLKCGKQVGQWIPYANIEDIESVNPFNENTRDYYINSTRELHAALMKRKRSMDYGEFTKRRLAALETPHWAMCKREVKKRCCEICEGCGKSVMSEVHHLTYRNLGKEFLFELVGLCSGCHNRYHRGENE